MQWFDDDPDASPGEQRRLLALDELISDLAVQRRRYAPRSEALVGLWTFSGATMADQVILACRGGDCTPVTFDRARLRGSVERLQEALTASSGRPPYALRIGVDVGKNNFTLDAAYSAEEAAPYAVTAATWRDSAARLDPRGRYTGKTPWWKRTGGQPDAFRSTAERYVAAWQEHRMAQGAAGQETVGMAALDDGATTTAMVSFHQGQRRDIHPGADDACVLLGYNLLDESDPVRPAALLTYATPGKPPQVKLFHGETAVPWLVTRTRHDLLAPKVRSLFA